jgi:16S rRNA (guanine(1405)-N(7))-methyltransferase
MILPSSITASGSLESLVEQIHASPKYRMISPDTIRDLLRQELPKHRQRKAGIAATRKKLHQVAAHYLGDTDFEAAEESLAAAFAAGSDEAVRQACLAILRSHASSRERLDELPEIYPRIWEMTGGPPPSVLDLACALHPLGWRWMGLPRTALYHAYDLDERVVALVNLYFRLEGVQPGAVLQDVVCSPPAEEAEVALLLKMYHCLETRRRGAGWEMIQAVRARQVVVSFPRHNLRGRQREILDFHAPDLTAHVIAEGWSWRRLDLQNEAFLIVTKT